MNIAEEFTLLAYRNDGSPEIDSTRLNYGLGGALLLELALAHRIDAEDKKVVVRDPAPLGDPLLDEALGRIAAEPKVRKPGHWVSAFAKDTRRRTLDALVDAGVLTRQQDKVLLVFDRTRYPATDGVEPVPETEARQRLVAAVSGTGPVEPRTAALCALVGATGMDRKVFGDLNRQQTKKRLKEISEDSWAATAVKKTIEEIQAAVALSASMTATTVVLTAS
ncbi:GPP34 family phosphoprotein [Actinoplanes sp. NPDC051346]|uniref:GOLPH3/VPS74 family protein n=1 Tax=Actinoplanes sp. NPDC051346 TaxID=3155048 RepID=UPI00343C28F3